MIPIEFQAVVLAAGRGSRFPDLTEGRPKCLLPVGPFPLVWYPLSMLQRHGFSEIIVVVLESQKSEIQQSLDRTPLKARIDYYTISAESDLGTADTLRLLGEKIQSDLIVVTCDLVTNVSLYPLINKFRQHDASVVALLMKGSEGDALVPGPKSKDKPERDLIMTNIDTDRLIFSASLSDFEEQINLPGHLFRANGKVRVTSRLLDAHVYVMKRWVIDFLQESKGFSTLKGELLPYVIKKQMSCPATHSDNEKLMSDVNVNVKIDDIFNFVTPSSLIEKIAKTTLYSEEKYKPSKDLDLIKCYAVYSPPETFSVRVNTLKSFCAANQNIFLHNSELIKDSISLISQNAIVESNQVTQCAIGDGSKINAKTSLKNSTIGSNCTVNPKVRISDCIIMNDVEIEEGVVLENCIICDKAVIKKGSTLKHCFVGFNFNVPEGAQKERTNFTSSSTYMEI